MQFDPSAPSTIARLNHHLANNTGTRELTCQMTQKPHVVQTYGRYLLTSSPFRGFVASYLIEKPSGVYVDGAEVLWGSDNLEDFEAEIMGLLGQESVTKKAA